MTEASSLQNPTKLRLSPTKMMAWDECPRKLKEMLYGERDKPTIYTEIGTAAHTVLELLNKGEKMTPEQRELRYREELIKLCSIADIPLMWTDGFKAAKAAIRDYAIPAGYEVFQAERKQVLEFENYDFSYIIDVIFINRDLKKVRIRDFKTGKTPGKPMQLWLYAWGTVRKFPELADYEIISEFDMLQKGKLVPVEITPETIQNMEAYMEKAVSNILRCMKLDHWPEYNDTGGCYFCSYKECPARAE